MLRKRRSVEEQSQHEFGGGCQIATPECPRLPECDGKQTIDIIYGSERLNKEKLARHLRERHECMKAVLKVTIRTIYWM